MSEKSAMPRKTWTFSSLLLCAMLSACGTTPQHSEQYLIYSDQLERNENRHDACIQGYARQYQAAGRFSNDKIARGALKQCRVYVDNYCHAWVERDLLDEEESGYEPFDWQTSAKAACIAQFTEVGRAELLSRLTKSGQ